MAGLSGLQYRFVEDEFHFVMVCNKLEHERNNLLYYITQKDLSFMHLNPFNKFLYLLKNESCYHILLAKCLYKMFTGHHYIYIIFLYYNGHVILINFD